MSDFVFVPGFAEALARAPATRALREAYAEIVGCSWLAVRTRALVALAVAQASGSAYALWANEVAARAAGLSGEDISLARAGTALDANENMAVCVARTAAISGIPDHVYDDPRSIALRTPEMQAVLAAVALCLLDNEVIDGLAPKRQEART